MELGPQNHNGDGLLGPNSIVVVKMDPLGKLFCSDRGTSQEENGDALRDDAEAEADATASMEV